MPTKEPTPGLWLAVSHKSLSALVFCDRWWRLLLRPSATSLSRWLIVLGGFSHPSVPESIIWMSGKPSVIRFSNRSRFFGHAYPILMSGDCVSLNSRRFSALDTPPKRQNDRLSGWTRTKVAGSRSLLTPPRHRLYSDHLRLSVGRSSERTTPSNQTLGDSYESHCLLVILLVIWLLLPRRKDCR